MSDQVAYLDHGSTAPLRKSALDAMMPYLEGGYGNASSPYLLGRESRAAVNQARERVAKALGVLPREIIFTCGATESIVLSMVGAFAGNCSRGRHIISTTFEHHAIHAVFDFLRDAMGAETEMVGVDRDGIVRMDELVSMLRDDTILLSVMHVNNEIGTMQDLNAIVELCSSKGVMVQSDFVQSIGKIPINLHELGIDLACASGHKFGAPKGTGILYVKEGTFLKNICEGSHEFGIRSGTENVAGIVGFAAALDEGMDEAAELVPRLTGFKEQLWDCIKEINPKAEFNGDQGQCVPAILNVCLHDCEGEMLVLALDRAGVAVSAGSACQTGSVQSSHVLRAIGLDPLAALSSFRLSMGYSTTQSDIDKFIEVFPDVYHQVKGAGRD